MFLILGNHNNNEDCPIFLIGSCNKLINSCKIFKLIVLVKRNNNKEEKSTDKSIKGRLLKNNEGRINKYN